MKRWITSKLDTDKIVAMAGNYDISAFLSALLYSGGITSQEQIGSFLCENGEYMDPFGLKGMDMAVRRINSAIEENESVCVFGDYDADGITATALLCLYLESRGVRVSYYIPDRETEGYGMNVAAVNRIKQNGVSLIITVDNGISAIDEVKHAKKNGMDVVVTDHHQQKREDLPDAVAVVNPHQRGCQSSFKDYAGVGVAFKLVCALEGRDTDISLMLDNYADLVALGTIADLVPVLGENRNFIRYALKNIETTNYVGLKALLEEANLSSVGVTATSLAFGLIPKINVTGRLASADLAVELFLTEDQSRARKIASALTEQNAVRQSLDRQVVQDIEDALERDQSPLNGRVIVLSDDKWHAGVVGIAASKIVAKYDKPCILISKDGTVSKASGRSVEGFSLYDAIFSCRDLFIKFGGHPMAVGFSIDTDKIEEFKRRIEEYAYDKFRNMPYNQLKISCKLKAQALNIDILDDINRLEPFGMGNPVPIFGLFKVKITDIMSVSNGKHTRFILEKDGECFEAIRFAHSISELGFRVGDVVDLAVCVSKNEYNGSVSLSIKIEDMRHHGFDYDSALVDFRLYESFSRGEPITNEERSYITPQRQDFAKVYRYLKLQGKLRSLPADISFRIGDNSMNIAKLLVMLDVLHEMNLINMKRIGEKMEISVIDTGIKVDLSTSTILNKLK